ncbi:hypothetical protein [Hyphomicrobium sp.]|uniref:hypothetical protein n=1 Tax=Hyphomicrobium sp. TaxID=82 RepID=UPI002FE1FD2C
MKPQHSIPVPARMQQLPRDQRGYPVPVIVLRDNSGRPHFTMNDEAKRQRIIREDRCAICGGKLFRGRWSVGGPLSAFHPFGRYNDTPLHHECMTYALQVCPYLAMPSYSKRLDAKTAANAEFDATLINIDPTVLDGRPELFVAVMHIGQSYSPGPYGLGYVIPKRPYRHIEYWQNGARIDPDKGKTLSDRILADYIKRNPLPAST